MRKVNHKTIVPQEGKCAQYDNLEAECRVLCKQISYQLNSRDKENNPVSQIIYDGAPETILGKKLATNQDRANASQHCPRLYWPGSNLLLETFTSF